MMMFLFFKVAIKLNQHVFLFHLAFFIFLNFIIFLTTEPLRLLHLIQLLLPFFPLLLLVLYRTNFSELLVESKLFLLHHLIDVFFVYVLNLCQ